MGHHGSGNSRLHSNEIRGEGIKTNSEKLVDLWLGTGMGEDNFVSENNLCKLLIR